MIAKIFTQLPTGVLACLHVRIQLPQSVVEHTDYKHLQNADAANKHMQRMLAKWITNQLLNYCNQRMHALMVAGAYGKQHQTAIATLEKITAQSGYEAKCHFVVRHQQEINLLMPSQNSVQYRWHYIFHHLIHHCHETTQANHLHPESNLHPVAEGVSKPAI